MKALITVVALLAVLLASWMVARVASHQMGLLVMEAVLGGDDNWTLAMSGSVAGDLLKLAEERLGN